MPMKATETIYKGRPTLMLTWEGTQWPDKYPMALGISNAKRVLAAQPQIKAFVDAHRNDPRPAPRPEPEAARGEYSGPPAARQDAPAGPRALPPPRPLPTPREATPRT